MTQPEATRAAEASGEYRRRLEDRRRVAEAASARSRALSGVRLAVFGAFVLVLGFVLLADLSGHWLWAPAGVFAVLVVLHQRADRRAWEARALARLYERGLARLEDRWAGEGAEGLAYRPRGHVFADDLDLFGPGSLFQLLSTARTRAGEERLASWLVEPASTAEVRARQDAVRELAPRLEARETLAVVGGEISSALDRARADAWGGAPLRLSSRALPRLVGVSGLASAVLLSGWAFGGWPLLPALLTLAVQLLLTLPLAPRVSAVLAEAERPSGDLDLVGRLLRPLEEGGFESEWLRSLARGLETDGAPPSHHIARLTRLVDFVEARRNQIFLPLSWLLGLGTQLAFALERWRATHGRHLPLWVDAVGSFEAIHALATFAYEHDGGAFPQVLDDGTRLEGIGLGHPLLPRAACVLNDVVLEAGADGGTPQALLVSGSNMSGKSTLLRTVGVNVVLAMTGAPVVATSLRLAPLALGCSIRIHDSLQSGESHFYAEIARLRKIVDLSEGERPCLFLLDEVLHGTNSHDRGIGAEAVLRSLLSAGAIGLVTTHDLALADVAARDPRMQNVHFEDHIEDGRMEFDYRLHEGVVTRSNAIELMRAVGLKV